MGHIINLYELFQLNILNDTQLLEIGKKPKLDKIILTENSVQVISAEWLISEYEIKK